MKRRTVAAGAAVLAAVGIGFLLLGGDPGLRSRGVPVSAGPARGRPPDRSDVVRTIPAVADPGTAAEAAAEPGIPEEAAGPEAPPGPRRAVLEGRVVGIRGEGVSGARVARFTGAEVHRRGTLDLTRILEQAALPVPAGTVTTDPEGRFRIEAVPGETVALEASAEGYAPTSLDRFTLLEDRTGVVLALEAAAPVRGRVLQARHPDPGGGPLPPEPAAGVRVLLLGGPVRTAGTFAAEARSGSEGEFSFDAAPPGRPLQVVVLGSGPVPNIGGTDGPVYAPGPEIRILLPPVLAARVAGVVVREDRMTPAGGVRIRATCRLPRVGIEVPGAEAVSGADGTFVLPALLAGATHRILFDGGEAGHQKLDLWIPDGSDREERVVLWTEPRADLRGTVSGPGPDGAPAAVGGLRLLLRTFLTDPGNPRNAIPLERTATTRPDGAFEFRDLPLRRASLRVADPAGGEWALAGGALAVDPPVPGEPWEIPVEAVPRHPGRIEGTVRAADGRPGPGVLVGVGDRAVLTDDRGAFVLEGVTPDVDLRVHARAPDGTTATEGPLRVPPGGTVGVSLSLPDRLPDVRGRIRDAAGDGVPGALVALSPSGQPPEPGSPAPPWSRTVSGPGGDYRLSPSAGPWRVTASKEGYGSAFLDAIVPGFPVPDIILVPGPSGAEEER